MKSLAELSCVELRRLCTCEDSETLCRACSVIEAIQAGIPRSVVAGKTKLSDHFSEDYINWKCNKETPERE
jgi:hypothetical protein